MLKVHTDGNPFKTVEGLKKHRRVNVQGLSRQEKLLMGGLRPDNGNLIYSIDYVSLEPAITTHYTNDPMYRWATFDGIGKEPYWNNGILMIDDIYLMVASANPCTREVMEAAYRADWGGKTFVEQWLEDSEVIKKALKKSARAFNKTACLGFGYGMGAKTFYKNATESGHNITMADAKATYSTFWSLFKEIEYFANYLASETKKHSRLVNDFGYRLTPEPRKAYNAWIQSSASGVLDLLDLNMTTACPWFHLHAFIHDEILGEIPKVKLEDTRKLAQECVSNVNQTLNWSLDLRIGEAWGNSWFEAK